MATAERVKEDTMRMRGTSQAEALLKVLIA
jgi:hypothetical protein